LGGYNKFLQLVCIFSKNRGGDPKGFSRWPNYLVEQRILPAKRPNPTEKPLGFVGVPQIIEKIHWYLDFSTQKVEFI
jgi:hypothetical protein